MCRGIWFHPHSASPSVTDYLQIPKLAWLLRRDPTIYEWNSYLQSGRRKRVVKSAKRSVWFRLRRLCGTTCNCDSRQLLIHIHRRASGAISLCRSIKYTPPSPRCPPPPTPSPSPGICEIPGDHYHSPSFPQSPAPHAISHFNYSTPHMLPQSCGGRCYWAYECCSSRICTHTHTRFFLTLLLLVIAPHLCCFLQALIRKHVSIILHLWY